MNGISIDRADFAAIAQWVKPGARVLDLGCGDGVLFKYLKRERDISGYGVEIDDANVLACVKNGVNVVQRNLERGLREFEDQSFDQKHENIVKLSGKASASNSDQVNVCSRRVIPLRNFASVGRPFESVDHLQHAIWAGSVLRLGLV